MSINYLLAEAPGSGRYLEKALSAVYDDNPLEDDGCKRASRRSSNVLVIVATILADIAFIPVSMPLGKIWGPVCALGNSATFMVLDLWTAKGIIHSLWGAKTREEQDLILSAANNPLCRTAASVTTAFFIALLAQVPHVLATMKYNDPQYKLAAGIILGITGCLLPLRSIQLSIDSLCRTQEAAVRKTREKLSDLLGACRAAFINMSDDDKNAFIQKTNAAHSLEEKLIVLTQPNATPLLSPMRENVKKAFNYAGLGLGTILAITLQYSGAQYTFVEIGKQGYSNDLVAGLFAALTFVCTIQLVGLSILQTTKRIFNVCGSWAVGGKTQNLSWQQRPGTSAAWMALGLLMNIAALGPNYVIWRDFYNSDKVTHVLFPTMICAAYFSLFFTSTLDGMDGMVADSLKKGTDREKAIFQVIKDMSETLRLIQECPSRELANFASSHAELLARIGAPVSDPSTTSHPSYGIV
ncbi:MAG: hypothetical protein HW387_768 [Parachlamydiales bacterium]|nr:hypothetical protein [Parachlamydiales bacterium]